MQELQSRLDTKFGTDSSSESSDEAIEEALHGQHSLDAAAAEAAGDLCGSEGFAVEPPLLPLDRSSPATSPMSSSSASTNSGATSVSSTARAPEPFETAWRECLRDKESLLLQLAASERRASSLQVPSLVLHSDTLMPQQCKWLPCCS